MKSTTTWPKLRFGKESHVQLHDCPINSVPPSALMGLRHHPRATRKMKPKAEKGRELKQLLKSSQIKKRLYSKSYLIYNIQMALRCIRQVRALILEACLMCSCARRSMPLCAAWIFLAASSWKFCKSRHAATEKCYKLEVL